MKKLLLLTLVFCLAACQQKPKPEMKMNEISKEYVKLVHEIGLYDKDYVDAYYGPEELKISEDKKEDKFPYDKLFKKAIQLHKEVMELDVSKEEKIVSQRRKFFLKQLTAVKARIEMLNGKKFTFDEEAKYLYDVVPPVHTAEYFNETLNELDKVLPGKGNIQERLAKFKAGFVIPKEKLDTVFTTAIKEGRRRTKEKVKLPENENFKIEYVTGKSWGAYNWYKGSAFSLIQYNTDITSYIDRAIDLACHEGYPGHHVYNGLLETELFKKRGWLEFSIYPLFSPQSVIAEGTANFGIEVSFPGEEKINYEKEVLFPIAGIDPAKADLYYKVSELTGKLNFAGNEAARNYIDGKFTKDEARDWLVKYLLMTPERADTRIRFIEKYGAYVVNYNLGMKMVKDYIKRKGGTADKPEKRWELFIELLSMPVTPTELLL